MTCPVKAYQSINNLFILSKTIRFPFFQNKSIYGQKKLQDVLVHMICSTLKAVRVASAMAANADTLIPNVVHNVDWSNTAIIVSYFWIMVKISSISRVFEIYVFLINSYQKIFNNIYRWSYHFWCSMNKQSFSINNLCDEFMYVHFVGKKIKKYTTMNKWIVTKWFSWDWVKECCSLENENIHNITNCDMLYTSYKTTTKWEDGYCIVRYNQTCQLSFHLISQITALTCSHIKKDCESAAKANICCFAVYYIWI